MSASDHATTIGRRRLLVAGLVLSGGALVAVRQQSKDRGGAPEPTTTSTTPPRRGPSDLVILDTAISVERSLVRMYDALFARTTELPVSDSTNAIVQLIASHHRDVTDALAERVETLGATPYGAPNALIVATQVDPIIARAEKPAEMVAAAHALERDAARYYVWACRNLSEPTLRTEVMRVGSVTARHAAALGVIAEVDDADPGIVKATLPFDDQVLLPEPEPLSTSATDSGR